MLQFYRVINMMLLTGSNKKSVLSLGRAQRTQKRKPFSEPKLSKGIYEVTFSLALKKFWPSQISQTCFETPNSLDC